MSRVAIGVVACSVAGCAQLFGLDETSSKPDALVTPFMSLSIERVSFASTVARGPADLTGQTATYLVDDGVGGFTRVPATLATNDRWTAEIAEGTAAAVEFTLPEPVPVRRLYNFGTRTISAQQAVFEHPNPEPAPDTGIFAVRLTLPTAYISGQSFRLYGVGPWVLHDFPAGELPAPDVGNAAIAVDVSYIAARFPSLVGPRPLLKVTTQDQLVALRYAGNDLTAAAIITPFDQTGGTDPVMGALDVVPHAPLDVRIEPSTAANRLSGTSPAVSSLSMAWSVHASPAWQFASGAGPQLHAVGIGPTDPGVVTTAYGNPFEALGWKSLFTWSTLRTRAYTVPALSLGVTLYAHLVHAGEPIAGTLFDQPAGLPVLVSINGVPLNTDGLTVRLDPAKTVQLSLIADRPTNTYYQWNIYELVPNSAMPPSALDYKLVYVAHANATSVTIPNDVLVTGKVYTVRGHAFKGGFPDAATGNFQNRDLPLSYGYLDSGVFTVAAP